MSFETLSWEWAAGGTLKTEGRGEASMLGQTPRWPGPRVEQEQNFQQSLSRKPLGCPTSPGETGVLVYSPQAWSSEEA